MPASKRARTHSSRPYERSPTVSPKSLCRQSPLPALPTEGPPDQPGLPTYAEYKRIEAGYLQSLSPRKRDKALITQAMFDKIWDVLHQPDACTVETPQFRFWVRKMFTLSRPETDAGEKWQWQWGTADWQEEEADLELERAMGIERDADAAFFTSAVVLHDNRPVAIMEQLYELFCYCHVRAGHGGRDKTCAVIREHYSWVPKELTAQFVKACPTCALKRCGGGDMSVMLQRRVATTGRERRRVTPVLTQAAAPASLGWPTTGGPLDLANPPPCNVRERLRGHEGTNFSSSSGLLPSSSSGSAPKGVPSRWTNMSGTPSPIRAFNPMRTLATGFSPKTHISEVTRTPEKTGGLPSLASALSNESLDDVVNLTRLSPHDDGGACLPPALRPLRLSGPVSSNTKPEPDFPIDPILLSFSYPELRHSASPGRSSGFGSPSRTVGAGAGTPEARKSDDRMTVRLRCAREDLMMSAFNMPDSPAMRLERVQPFSELSSPSRLYCGYSPDRGPFAGARLLPCAADLDSPGRQLEGTLFRFSS